MQTQTFLAIVSNKTNVDFMYYPSRVTHTGNLLEPRYTEGDEDGSRAELLGEAGMLCAAVKVDCFWSTGLEKKFDGKLRDSSSSQSQKNSKYNSLHWKEYGNRYGFES